MESTETTTPARKVFELVGKHKSTITGIDILCLKMGQTDVRPAVCVSMKTLMPNREALPMFSLRLLPFLYEKDAAKPATQATLEGVDVISDTPNLTAEAVALGALDWEYEQTGCKLVVYEGNSKRVMTGGTVRKVKLDPKEGGTTEVSWQFYTAENVDDEVIGHLGVLKSLDRDVELTAPEVLTQQQTIETEADEGPEYTPLDAMKDAHAEAGTAAEGRAKKRLDQQKKVSRKRPLAKSIARSSRAAKKAKAH